MRREHCEVLTRVLLQYRLLLRFSCSWSKLEAEICRIAVRNIVSAGRMLDARKRGLGGRGGRRQAVSAAFIAFSNRAPPKSAGSGRAAALDTGTRRWPEHGPRLPAAFPVVNLPIYFSSGDDRRMQRARATTARYGRDSAAAGQGARARSRQRAEGATVGCTNGEAGIHPGASADQVKWAGVRGSSAHNCNLRLPAICRKHSCSGFGELP